MTKRHRSPGVIAGLILVGTALGGLTLLLARRQSEQGAEPTLEGSDSSRDSWLPDDVLDLPTASGTPATDRAGVEHLSRDDDLADIFDRPRS